VIVSPDEIKMIEFNNGMLYGLNCSIDNGGQFIPISILGVIDLWKYVQKNATKNNNSEMINRIILIFVNFVTVNVWNPWNVLSRITSRHHWNRQRINVISLIINGIFIFKYINKVVLIIIFIILIDVIIGQGLNVTIWNGWFEFIIIWLIEV